MPLVVQNDKLRVDDGKLSVGGAECCCLQCDTCVEVSWTGETLEACANCCHGDEEAHQYGQTTITIPEDCPTPVLVTITGTIDDELVIDGVVVQQNMYPGDNPCYVNQDCSGCNGAHSVDYSFECAGASFDLAVGDNHGADVYYNLTICFQPAPP